MKENLNNTKSNRYQADNYPIYFEKEHRTEDAGILPPKDRLKEFNTKHVDKYVLNLRKDNENNTNNNNLDNENNDKKPSIDDKAFYSTLTSNFKSTAYGTFYNTSSNPFINTASNFNTKTNFNNKQPFDINFIQKQVKKEIKANYSYHRPALDLANLEIEKRVFNEKNKELREKRNLEENKEFIDKWGRSRAFYKENLLAKSEMLENIKNLSILIEENSLKKKEIVNSAFSDYKENENEKENQKILEEKLNKIEEDKSVKKKDKIKSDNSEDDEEMEAEVKEEEVEVIVLDPYKVKKIDMEKPKVVSSLVEENILKKEGIILPNKSSINNNFSSLNNFNIRTNNINIVKNNFKPIKQNNSSLLNFIKIDLDNNDKPLPSDAVPSLKTLDPVFAARTNYANFININQRDNVKYTHLNAFNPLSGYDTLHILGKKNKMFNEFSNNIHNFNNKQRPTTGSDLLRSNYFKLSSKNNSINNLENRKIISQFNSNLAVELKENQMKDNNNYNLNCLRNALIPNENNKIYRKLVLPIDTVKGIERPVESAKGKKPKRPKSRK